MSFKAPRPPRASLRSSSLSRKTPSLSTRDASRPTPCSHQLVPRSDVPKTPRGYGTKGHIQLRNNGVLAEPLGHVFVQQPALPHASTVVAVHPPNDDSFVDTGDIEPPPIYISAGGDDPELRQQRQRLKKERQSAKWANETIPSLLQPYLRILRESDNLRTLNRHSNVTLPPCSCKRRAGINVTCVFFDRKLF